MQFPEDGLPATLSQLLVKLNVDADTVVAEIEGNIVKREKFGSTKLSAGQNIELVRFVPGG
jgi:thiamine biosynthesis protein ThiS